jgi:branched-chain amino acid transport system ATP-binding protein
VTADTVLELHGVAVGYGGVPVLDAVDATVRAGEVVAVLGANGVGKTTLLKSIAGVIRPISGRADFVGTPLTGPLHRRARRGIALVTEERAIIRKLTVAENLRLGTRQPAEALALFPELQKVLHRKAGLLSGGEQQMLVLGRVLANDVRLLLVDEMSFGLAPLVVRRLLDAIRAAADRGAAVLLAEQHPALALSIADRGYVLSRGSVRLAGAASDLLGRLEEIEQEYLSIVPGTQGRQVRAVPPVPPDDGG